MPKLITLEYYAEQEQAQEDCRVLEEAGFHPSIHPAGHGQPLDSPAGAPAGHTVEICVPENEAQKAMEILEVHWETLADDLEDYAEEI